MISAPKHAPGTTADSMDLAHEAHRKARLRRRKKTVRFVAIVVAVAGTPFIFPAFAAHPYPATFPPATVAPISVEEPRYANTPAERPEGLSLIRIRRIR